MTTEHQQAEKETAANIRRYDRDEGGMFPSKSGDWVLYEYYLEQMNASMEVPPGMALVPIEPTPEMIRAGEHTDCENMENDSAYAVAEIYRVMLAASQDSAKETK